MGVAHSLENEQMRALNDSMSDASQALRDIERRTKIVEQYISSSAKTQKKLNTSAKECIDTLEQITTLINTRGDRAQNYVGRVFRKASERTQEMGQVVQNLKIGKVKSVLIEEFKSFFVPIYLLTTFVCGCMVYASFKLSRSGTLVMTEGVDGPLATFWRWAAIFNLTVFLFICLWIVFEGYRIKYRRVTEAEQNDRLREAIVLIGKKSLSQVQLLGNQFRELSPSVKSIRRTFSEEANDVYSDPPSPLRFIDPPSPTRFTLSFDNNANENNNIANDDELYDKKPMAFNNNDEERKKNIENIV